MKICILFFISALLFSSCTIDWNNERGAEITTLKTKIQSQEVEIASLKDQIRKLKSGLWNNEFGEVTPLEGGFTGPEEMTYKEVNNEACIKKAQEQFLQFGNEQCKQQGFTDEDIKNKKCKLTREFIEVITKKMNDAVIACGPGN